MFVALVVDLKKGGQVRRGGAEELIDRAADRGVCRYDTDVELLNRLYQPLRLMTNFFTRNRNWCPRLGSGRRSTAHRSPLVVHGVATLDWL
jgi:hypothetical protein